MSALEYRPGRSLDPDVDVWVYRNLMRSDGSWYSIMQRGVVVAHARRIALAPARFVVRPAGRRRALETGVKNVHAFVVGRIAPMLFIDYGDRTWTRWGERLAATYSTKPGSADTFTRADPEGPRVRLERAALAVLDHDGLHVHGPDPVL